ncbi:MAG: hypothetical protein IPN34_03040 [Planctomycetes bacterium]|nr:hypothetical protein [Planctomycetota bacterium]
MKLPCAAWACVAPSKVHSYLLSPDHPDGRHKAIFFGSLGYAENAWRVLREDLRNHAREGNVVGVCDGPFGRRYRVRGNLLGPTGRTAVVITVWIVPFGATTPRFLTAFPRSWS